MLRGQTKASQCNCKQSRASERQLAIPLHMELSLVLAGDSKAEPLVEPQGGIDLHNFQPHALPCPFRLLNQALY